MMNAHIAAYWRYQQKTTSNLHWAEKCRYAAVREELESRSPA